MQIKRFEAKNMTTALRMIKNELGPEAVILSARSLRKGKGFFGSLKYAGVEISAAIDNQLSEKNTTQATSGQDLYRRYPKKSRIQASRPERRRNDTTQFKYAPAIKNPVSGYRVGNKSSYRKTTRALSSLYQQILLQEVDRGIASELIEEIRGLPASDKIMSKADIKSHLGFILDEMGVVVERNPFSNRRQTIMAFVGTTGVGKTTTIAKLAARLVKEGSKNVGLITIDNYRVAANQQLETYAHIIGIPLETAHNAGDLKKAVKRFKDKDFIFIDTSGINPKNLGQVQGLKAYLTGLNDLKIQLIMSATTKEKDCIAIADAFKEIGVDQLIFTKTDESSIFGNMVNVLIQTQLPLSFLCGGRKVPDDIEAGTVPKLVDLLLATVDFSQDSLGGVSDSNPEKTQQRQDSSREQPPFMANKNSDVYHLTDCNWAKKIKPANILYFSEVQEAERQNFLPCRSCNPNREHQGTPTVSNTELMQYNSYG